MADRDVVILAGARTPFGIFGGSLRTVSATELGIVAARAALQRAGVAPEQVDNVVFGNVLQTSGDAIYIARHVSLKSGVPIPVPALTVNRLCGSGLQALVTAAQSIRLGESDIALAGGAENMSQAPHVVRGARWGLGLGEAPMEDYLWTALVDSYNGLGMALTAENLAERYGLRRQEVDEYAYRSHKEAARARESGLLAEEIEPVTVQVKGREVVVSQDEHIRPDVTMEALAKLPPRFKPGGVVTAGNASGINDGAVALVLASAQKAAALGLRPIARLVSYGYVGVDPDIMGIGPVPASQLALKRAGLTWADMDLIEINEAFSAQVLACVREADIDMRRLNVNGGAVALGHPLGASGARLALTVIHELRRRRGRYGLASLCIGGGQGIAAIFEALY